MYFDTDRTTDWLEGLPILGVPAFGGFRPGLNNVGDATVSVASIDAGAILEALIAEVVQVSGGQSLVSVADLDGHVLARGVAGLPIYAGGVTLTVSPVQGQASLAAGDTFAVAFVPAPLDVSGWVFSLTARPSPLSASVVLSATSNPASSGDPAILNGGASGGIAMRVPRPIMAALKPDDYSYGITAFDPATGRTVAVFGGTIRHRAVPTLSG